VFQGGGFPETLFLRAVTSKIAESEKYAPLSMACYSMKTKSMTILEFSPVFVTATYPPNM